MDNLNELKAIWQTADRCKLPEPGDIKRSIKTFQSQRVRKKWLAIIVSVFFLMLMVGILMFLNSKMITTWVGGGLMALAWIILGLNNLRSLKRFNQLDDCSNREFLAFIDQTGLNQQYHYKKTQLRILVLCVVGLSLYLYEPATHSLAATIALYIITIAFLVVNWLVLRPMMFKRNTEKLNRMRNHFEKLIKQLETNEK